MRCSIKFDGGPVGIETLAAAVGEERDTLEDVYEPYLVKEGFVDRTPRGRVATRRAYEHFKKNGFFGYMKSLIPAGVREMGLGARIGLGAYIFLLEFFSTFIIRPLTLAVRLFANMYAGHIIIGIFSAFVALSWAKFSIGGGLVGGVSLVMTILMYAFEVFVAFIQAYVFAILTAVYIGSSLHAAEH